MVDNLIKGVILGIVTYVWYYFGTSVPWTGDGSFGVTSATGIPYAIPGLGYLFFTFLAFMLARGGK